jgi:hypothetical protein
MTPHQPVEIDRRERRVQFTRLPLAEAQDNPACRLALRQWRLKCGARPMPTRTDFDPRELKPVLAQLILIDVIDDPPDFRYRLASRVVHDLGDAEPNAPSVLDLAPRQYGQMLWNDLCEMQQTCEPQYVQTSVIGQTGEPLSYRVLRLPLGTDRQTLDMVLVAQDYGNALPLLRKYADEWRSF